MFDRNYYVICDDGCKFESMTKEQILAAIAEATGTTVTDVDAAFISKVKELNKGGVIKFWRGTQAEYNALTEIDANCYYIITDDTTLADLEKKVAAYDETISATEKKVDEVAEKITDIEKLTTIKGEVTVYDDDNDVSLGTVSYIKRAGFIEINGMVSITAGNNYKNGIEIHNLHFHAPTGFFDEATGYLFENETQDRWLLQLVEHVDVNDNLTITYGRMILKADGRIILRSVMPTKPEYYNLVINVVLPIKESE